MKKRLKILVVFLLINVLSGCSVKRLSEVVLDERNPDCSSIGAIISDFSFAVLGTGDIAYLTNDPQEVVLLDNKKNQKFVALPSKHKALEITAGNDYFYVYSTGDDEMEGFLDIYDNKGKLLKEISLPFKRVNVRNGLVYGYYDKTVDFFDWGSNSSNSHIEATHYISEKKLLKKFPCKINEWHKISGGEIVNISGQKLYQCLSDFYHGTDYYSDVKPLSVLKEIDYVRYCDGKIASEENEDEVSSRLNQIYGMMKKKEDNFLIYSFEADDAIYGICNVYKRHGNLSSFSTSDIEYSFSFSYLERADKLIKKNEYEKRELVYEDEYNCLYHESDGVYYMKLGSDINKKIYNYNGEIEITLLEGYVKFRERKTHYDDNIDDKQEIIKVWLRK